MYEFQVIFFFIDETVKIRMSGLYSASLAPYIPHVTFSRISVNNFLFTEGCKNDRRGIVPSPASCVQP